jgi:hypothetical protein
MTSATVPRAVRLGVAMMQGGYRRLLLYPFRGRI